MSDEESWKRFVSLIVLHRKFAIQRYSKNDTDFQSLWITLWVWQSNVCIRLLKYQEFKILQFKIIKITTRIFAIFEVLPRTSVRGGFMREQLLVRTCAGRIVYGQDVSNSLVFTVCFKTIPGKSQQFLVGFEREYSRAGRSQPSVGAWDDNLLFRLSFWLRRSCAPCITDCRSVVVTRLYGSAETCEHACQPRLAHSTCPFRISIVLDADTVQARVVSS